MNTYIYYSELIKPAFAPPSWIFGPVWTALYILIAISFGVVLYLWMRKQISGRVALPFVLNLITNALFTPIQFGLKNNLLATIDIFLVVITLVWAMIVIFPIRPWIAYVNIPYLLWGLFATILQVSITYLNY